MTAPDHDIIDLLAARFVSEALSIDVPMQDLAPELTRLERDVATAVYAVELNSTVGPAAFLVYAYETTGAADDPGATRYATDTETLRVVQERDVPGPRLVATGEIEGHAFILATDPATFKALSAGATAVAPATTEDPDAGIEPAAARRAAAERLLPLLRDADRMAGRWLRAVDRSDGPPASGGLPAFDDMETELALYLLGPDGIRNILTLANRVLESAQPQAGPTAGPPTAGPEPTPIRSRK